MYDLELKIEATFCIWLTKPYGELSGDTEIGKLGVTLGVEQYVAGLDVPVDLAAKVQVLEALERVGQDRRDLLLLQRLLAESHDV